MSITQINGKFYEEVDVQKFKTDALARIDVINTNEKPMYQERIKAMQDLLDALIAEETLLNSQLLEIN